MASTLIIPRGKHWTQAAREPTNYRPAPHFLFRDKISIEDGHHHGNISPADVVHNEERADFWRRRALLRNRDAEAERDPRKNACSCRRRLRGALTSHQRDIRSEATASEKKVRAWPK
jgi:hypothetical protein